MALCSAGGLPTGAGGIKSSRFRPEVAADHTELLEAAWKAEARADTELADWLA